MKNDIADILFKYTTGEATLEETNDALKEAEAGFNLEPGRNEITPDEMALTTVGDTPEEANGFGLLDTGTGSMEKVHVTNGKLDEAINQGFNGQIQFHDQYAGLRHHRPQSLRGQGRHPDGLLKPTNT